MLSWAEMYQHVRIRMCGRLTHSPTLEHGPTLRLLREHYVHSRCRARCRALPAALKVFAKKFRRNCQKRRPRRVRHARFRRRRPPSPVRIIRNFSRATRLRPARCSPDRCRRPHRRIISHRGHCRRHRLPRTQIQILFMKLGRLLI